MIFLRTGLAIVAIYLELALPISSSVYVPHITAFLLALTLLPKLRYRRWMVISALVVVLFCIFNLLTTSYGSVSIAERSKSVIYLLWMFGIAVVLVAVPFVDAARRRHASLMFMGAGFGLLVFAMVEQRSSLARVSDWFRYYAYPGMQYENDERDLVLLGETRPKAFTREPSYVARGISLLLIFGALLARNAAAGLAALAGIAATIIVTGSPTPVGFALCLLYGLPVPRWYVRHRLVITFQLALTALALLVLLVAAEVIPVLRQRLELVQAGADASSRLRTTFMMEMAGKALRLNPVSGVGFGGEDELNSDFSLPSFEQAPTTSLINNGMWSIPFFTGLTGSALFIALLWGMARRVPVEDRVVFVLTILATLNVTGAINSTEAWFVGALLYTVTRVGVGDPSTVTTTDFVRREEAVSQMETAPV